MAPREWVRTPAYDEDDPYDDLHDDDVDEVEDEDD